MYYNFILFIFFFFKKTVHSCLISSSLSFELFSQIDDQDNNNKKTKRTKRMIVSYINFLYSFDYIKISINDEQLEKELIYFNFQFFFCSCFFL